MKIFQMAHRFKNNMQKEKLYNFQEIPMQKIKVIFTGFRDDYLDKTPQA